MSTALAPQAISPAISTTAPAKRWLVGPWFDLLFLANLGWPVAAYLAFVRPLDDGGPLSIFQVYFLSTPHRWITLALVFSDSQRFRQEPVKFIGIGVALVLLGLALVGVAAFVPYATGSLMLLMMLDYVWNAWHFAAQHAGIARIYGRMTRPEQTARHAEFEKMALRTPVLWVFFRLALHLGVNSPYGESIRWLPDWLMWLDPIAFVPAILLLAREAGTFRPQCVGRVAYIGSVLTLYAAQLVAIRVGSAPWMIAFFFAGAVFHAVEYLAICNWAVQKRTTGIWHYQVTRTGLALVVFMAVLGAANWFVSAQSAYAWQLITLLVSLLHYGYDGMIWKARPTSRAR